MKTNILQDFHICIGVTLRYLHFCPNFFGHVEKEHDVKAKHNFKIYDFINWETITQYFNKLK